MERNCLDFAMFYAMVFTRGSVTSGGGLMEAKILPDSVSELQQKIARAEEVKRI